MHDRGRIRRRVCNVDQGKVIVRGGLDRGLIRGTSRRSAMRPAALWRLARSLPGSPGGLQARPRPGHEDAGGDLQDEVRRRRPRGALQASVQGRGHKPDGYGGLGPGHAQEEEPPTRHEMKTAGHTPDLARKMYRLSDATSAAL